MHFCDKIKVFSVTFDPFNAPFLSKNVIKNLTDLNRLNDSNLIQK